MRLLLGVRSAIVVLALWGLSAAPTVAVGQQSGNSTQVVREGVAIADSTDDDQSQRRRRRRSAASSNVGYIDNALIGTQLQLRFDRVRAINSPDRAEFIYGKCGCYRVLGADLDAPGPSGALGKGDPLKAHIIEINLRYREFVIDGEVALGDRFSVFAEIPLRFLNGELINGISGIGDIQAGVKFGIVSEEERALTFQFKTYLPTGKAIDGLGTDHLSLEPALLYHEAGGDRLKLEAELRLWIPIGGSTGLGTGLGDSKDFSGSVVRYGVGLGYDVSPDSGLRFTPIVELVGWTINSGIATKSSDGTASGLAIEDAGGTTILNVKVGARFGFRTSDSIFVGIGRSLTDEWWYKRVFRAEYRLAW